MDLEKCQKQRDVEEEDKRIVDLMVDQNSDLGISEIGMRKDRVNSGGGLLELSILRGGWLVVKCNKIM